MVEGFDIPEFGQTFGIDVNKSNFEVKAVLANTSLPGNILWPNDKGEFLIQLQNNLDKKVKVKGSVKVIAYATKGKAGDIWTPIMYKIAEVSSIAIEVTIEAKGYKNISLSPNIPEKFGAYALVADLGKYQRQFITSVVRTFSFENEKIQYPSFCLDNLHPDVLQRLGVHAIRYEMEYKPTTSPDFEEWYRNQVSILNKLNDAGIVVLIKMGAGAAEGDYLPLKTVRPWLDNKAVMQNTKCDYAWLPSYDEDFKKLVFRLASELGWPKGCINAFSLWNEPWEGLSISGWGADMIRYREIYSKMAEAVFEARDKSGVDVLVGGCSSTANALDKLFCDDSDTFLDKFDFCSIHYQGLAPFSTIKKWVDRKSPRGRVKIWDTESWIANTDDRVSAAVAVNRSAGYDRAMGVYRGNITDRRNSTIRKNQDNYSYHYNNTWSVAASIGAVQHFIGERKFKEILIKNGLPWVYEFNGLNNNPEDGTIVIVGDIGEEFGSDYVLHRTCRGLNEIKHELDLQKQINTLDAVKDIAQIKQLKKQIEQFEVLSGSEMIIDNKLNKFSLFDFYGNKVDTKNGKIVIPLDGRGFYLRSNGSVNSFNNLLDAIKNSQISGLEPLEAVAHDILNPIEKGAKLHITLNNILNRKVSGYLNIVLDNLTIKGYNSTISFSPYETKELYFDVTGASTPNNTYPLTINCDAGNDGVVIHSENIHVNYISARKIVIDGQLNDWTGAIPQPIISEDAAGQSLTEAAWFSFLKTKNTNGSGFSNGYLAYDDKYFYFAAQIADDSPDEGMRRFDQGDENYCFYPDTAYKKEANSSYTIRYIGKVKPKYSGQYSFFTNSDDGVRLWVNGKMLVDNWEFHGKTIDIGRIDLEAEKLYDIKMEYFQGNGNALAQLLWESDKQVKEIIPTKYLYSAKNETNIGNGLDAEMFTGVNFNKLVVKTISKTVNIDLEEGVMPDTAYDALPLTTLVWPKDVRKFSYRMNPDLPAGNFPKHDNVQIAFNVLNDEEKDLYPFPPGTMPKYTNYQCSDYEYALNQVDSLYGGGTEIYRLRHPDMPFKHHFPRQPKSKLDGAVNGATLKIVRENNTRIYEVAIPWSELPHVKSKLEKGQTIKFSYRVNDNTDRGCMELSRMRSVSKRNASFQVDWVEHWANELEFRFEPKKINNNSK